MDKLKNGKSRRARLIMNTRKRGRRSSSSVGSSLDAIEQLARQQHVGQQSLLERINLHHRKHSLRGQAQQLYAPSERSLPHGTSEAKSSQCDDESAVQRHEDAGVAADSRQVPPLCNHASPLMRYTLQVIRSKCTVRRSDIPKGKSEWLLFAFAFCSRLSECHHRRGVSNVYSDADVQHRIQHEEDVLYLVYDKAPPCGFRNVYWLQLTDESDVVEGERDYFTLGSLGFTHFHNDVVTEFFEIADWVNEKRAFDHMTMMKGLQRIQQMLFFLSWKQKTVRNKHLRMKAFLACSLFTCHPIAGQILLKIRTVCTEVFFE